jgi:hypothetical protein
VNIIHGLKSNTYVDDTIYKTRGKMAKIIKQLPLRMNPCGRPHSSTQTFHSTGLQKGINRSQVL